MNCLVPSWVGNRGKVYNYHHNVNWDDFGNLRHFSSIPTVINRDGSTHGDAACTKRKYCNTLHDV